MPLTGPIIQDKAVEINKKVGGDRSFKTSWLEKLKSPHRIRQLDISGEKLIADSIIVADYRKKFEQIIKERKLVEEQVFNCDETGSSPENIGIII